MAQLLHAFDARAYDPTQGAGSLPIGRHPVIIESSEVKGNSKNDGGFLLLTLKLIDGPQAGATGAYRLNLYSSSQQASEIAHRQLSAVCHVTGVFNVQDSAQLHNIPFVVEVGFQKGHEPGSSPEAKGYTEVKRVFDINGNEPGKQGQAAAAQAPAQQPAQQQQQAAAWGGQQQAPAQQQQQQPAAQWGGQAPAQQAPAQQAAAPAAWGGQAAPAQGQAAPWGQR